MITAPTGTSPVEPTPPVLTRKIVAFLQKFTVLLDAPRELWITFVIKLLGITAYQVMNMTIVLWLSSDLGFNDQHASYWVGAWSITMTAVTLLVGSLTDAIGLRRSFFLGVWVCVIARAVMTFTTNKWLALAGGLFPLAVGEALGTPVLIAAVRRYSNTRQRSISFSMIYAIMNAGFLISALLFDYLRHTLKEHGHFNFLGMELTTYRGLFLFAFVIELCLLPVLCFVREGAEATDEGVKITPRVSKYRHENLWNSFLLTARDGVMDTVRLFAGLLRQNQFYQLLAFLLFIGFLKILFKQMDYVFPKFGIRELGEGAPVGRLLGINNLVIVFLVPVIGAMTQKFSAYKMVVVGGMISAASAFIMALPTVWFQPLANSVPSKWLAHIYLGLNGVVHPYYVMTAIFILALSFGEAFYSPRVYEYAAAIAPKGQEASYGALSYVPFLLAKLFVGASGGVLLARYCPEQGVRHSGTMWLIFALATLVAPVGLIAFRRYIRVHEAGRED